MKKAIIVITVIVSLLAFAGTVLADAEYDAALKDYAGGNYKAAAIYLKAYVKKKPDPVAYYLLGYSLYKLGRFNEATEDFRQAYLIDPTFSPGTLGLAEKFPKVRAEKKKKRTHGHKKSGKRGRKTPHTGKKATAAKGTAHQKCPAGSKGTATGKTP